MHFPDHLYVYQTQDPNLTQEELFSILGENVQTLQTLNSFMFGYTRFVEHSSFFLVREPLSKLDSASII